MTKFIAIIPARYASTRFPGKPLALLEGKTILQRVYERVMVVFDSVVVATDDERIANHVESFGGRVVMTGTHHQSGTDRCFEAYQKIGEQADVVVNVQGDEPFIATSQLEQLKACFSEATTQIATLIKPFTESDSWESLSNPNTPKVVVNDRFEAMYFSRSVIPFVRGVAQNEWLQKHTFYKHIGLYAYRAEVLERLVTSPQSTYEKIESLEQLRWLQANYKIQTAITTEETIGIDTPEDLERAKAFLATSPTP